MSKIATITRITSRVLDKYRNSIPRKAFIDAIGSFFDYDPDCGYDVIIGNPPYSMALEFIKGKKR